jgi:hypothetical protein
MKRSRALALSLAALTTAAFYGCAASENKPTPLLRATDAGASNDDEGGADTSGGGAPNPASSGGKAGTELNTNNGEAGVPDGTCAADIFKAELVPLDMYIMLDVSGSMLGNTAAYDALGMPIEKWTAIKLALHRFIEEDTSTGVSVGLQYFPINKPNVPAACSSDADCGEAAPCFLHYCTSNLVSCVTQEDCGGSIFNQCGTMGRCGGQLCPVEDGDCLINGQPVACTKITSSVCTHVAQCDANLYAVPAKPIAPLPGSGASLLASLDAQIIDLQSQTPTGPALSGAIKHASDWAKAHRDHRVVAVIATDGVPSECAPTGASAVGAIAAQGFSATPSVDTFVIGVFSSTDVAQGKTISNAIAKAGGTKAAFVIDTSTDVASEFRSALKAVRGTQLACEFKIPEPQSKDPINYSLVNVHYKTGKKTSTLFFVGNADGCDPLSGGWYYDTDPALEDPTRIVVCPTTCTTFQGAANAAVDIAVGCQTVVK